MPVNYGAWGAPASFAESLTNALKEQQRMAAQRDMNQALMASRWKGVPGAENKVAALVGNPIAPSADGGQGTTEGGSIAPIGGVPLSPSGQEKLAIHTAEMKTKTQTPGTQYYGGASGGDDATLKAILNYTKDPKNLSLRRGTGGVSERERLLAKAHQVDPSYDETQFPVRSGVRKSFTSGADAKNLTSINTAVGHLDSLNQAAEDLANSKIPIWNTITNKAASATGDPRLVKFNNAANAVENEMANVFKGTGATDQEIKAWRSGLDSSQSPEQLKGSIDTLIHLMGSRLDALHQKYTSGAGKPADFRFLNKNSEKILQKLGVDPASIDPSAGETVAPGPATAPVGNRKPLEAIFGGQ